MITSTSNKQVMYACSLKEKKYRDKEGKFLIEGEHLITMADSKQIECIFTTKNQFTYKDCPIIEVSEEILSKISFTKAPQGTIAIVKKSNFTIAYDGSSYLLCDNVSDPGNMGTIIRTALAFHVQYIVLANGSVDIYNDKVIRGSQGAIFKINIAYANLKEVVSKLQEHKVEVFSSTLSKRSIDIKEVKNVDKYAIVVGNEGCGVSQEIIDASDYNIKIMHSENIDSLNVGVATSIMLYYFDALKA